MANAAKYSRGACGHMLKHYERAKDENGEYVRFGNQDIDTTRSHLNYNLGPERSGSQYSFIKQRCSEVYCLNRSDVNVLCSWVVTAPKGLDPADHDRFFRKTYDVLEEKYGRENVVSAWVHQDESGQPHMHFAFVPVVWDAKKERYTVKAKDVISKTELKKFHPWLTEVMKKEFGRDIGIETGELGTRGNLTMEQYKTVQEANAEVQRVKEKLSCTQEELAAAKTEIADLREQNAQMVKDYNLMKELLEDQERVYAANQKILASLDNDIEVAEEFLNQIPDWPNYEAESASVFSLLESFRKALQEFFSRPWPWRDWKRERGILEDVQEMRDKIVTSFSAMRGFEIREKVDPDLQRSRVVKASLDDLTRNAAVRVRRPKELPAKSRETEKEI